MDVVALGPHAMVEVLGALNAGHVVCLRVRPRPHG